MFSLFFFQFLEYNLIFYDGVMESWVMEAWVMESVFYRISCKHHSSYIK